MIHRTPTRSLACALALFAAAALYGCGSKDAASYVASAKSYLAKADYKSAVIQAKNAVQKDPKDAQARLVLADALYQSGDAAGAETEARKALDAGAPADAAYPLLARALIAQGQYGKVTSEFGTRSLESPQARADLAVSLATAHAAQGNVKAAQGAVDGALAADPENIAALLFDAQLAARGGDLAGARKHIESALAKDPKNVGALLMKAELEVADRHVDEGRKLMEQAIDAHPDAIAPRAALTALAIVTNRRDDAKAQVAKMKEIAKGDLRTLYYDAVVAYAYGDYKHASNVSQVILSARPDFLPAVLLSGLVDLQLGAFATADEKLRRVVQRVPSDLTARRGLALVSLRTGRPEDALDVVQPALARTPDDPALLRIAGEAYLASGRPDEAASAYERANAIDKGNVASEIRLAQVRFAAGETDRAFSDLETLSQNEKSSAQADMALFAAYLKRGEFDKALGVADTIEKKQPKSPLGANLRGLVFLAKRDLANARLNFEKALAIKPDYYPAVQSLSTIDIAEGKLQAARDRYEALLKKDPRNERLLLTSAQLLQLSDAPVDQVRAALQRAITANPASVSARVAAIGYEVRRQDAKAALAAAQSANAAIPNNPQLVELLANAQLANGDANQAIDTLKGLATLQPKNALVLVRLAEVQASIKDYSSALASVQKALAMQPGLSAAWAVMAKIYLVSGKPDAALAEAHKLQKEHADKSIGYALEAEILGAQNKLPEAAAAYRQALAREPIPPLAARTYGALQRAGMKAEAEAMAAKWNKEHPKDVTLLQVMAEREQQQKQYAAALDGYKKVLDVNRDSIPALNNTAWILIEQGKPEALEYAERAHRLAPFNPNVIDTLGLAATKAGDAKRGVRLLRMASAMMPNNPEIRLHLGKAQLDSGDKAGAKQTLGELSKLSKDSPLRAEAEKLLTTL